MINQEKAESALKKEPYQPCEIINPKKEHPLLSYWDKMFLEAEDRAAKRIKADLKKSGDVRE